MGSKRQIAEGWLAEFSHAVCRSSIEDLAEMFVEDSYWRDLLAFSWDIRTEHGRHSIDRKSVV